MLEDVGFGVLEAANADEALEVLGHHPEIGVLFTDINMPGSMDGLDLARCVHELRPDDHLISSSRPAKFVPAPKKSQTLGSSSKSPISSDIS